MSAPATGARLKLGGAEVSRGDKGSLRRAVTVVSSNAYLFGGTVRQTLKEGRKDAAEEQMEEVLRQVKLLDFVKNQGGLDMPLAERGANLSGGQRQRLALARALLKDSPVYIFDEATSNIDAESEEAIMAAITALKGTHTVLLISHRLANVVGSDRIVFLKKGTVAEQGTHRELMEKQGGYAALFRAQRELEQLTGEGEP